MTNNLAVGDSIIKKSDSHEIVIFSNTNNVKSRGEIENVGFRNISNALDDCLSRISLVNYI